MKLRFLSILCFVICILIDYLAFAGERYAVAKIPTPVLNTPDFVSVFGGKDGTTLKTDRCGMVRELEFIALPKTVFSIVSEIKSASSTIYQVETDEYPVKYETKLYVDSRFVTLQNVIHDVKQGTKPFARVKILPKKEIILSRLYDLTGNRYVWGGNVSIGVADLENLFYKGQPQKNGSERILSGVDCSGLLYQATDGYTPRNTWQLINYGKAIKIAGKSVDEIIKILHPLDLIVWNGHVVVVLNRETAIESRLLCGINMSSGVITTPLKTRLLEVIKRRKPVDSLDLKSAVGRFFVVRRWYGQN